MKPIRIVLGIAAAVLLGSCATSVPNTSATAGDFETYIVVLQPKPNAQPPRLEVRTKPKKCRGNATARNGCLGFDQGAEGVVVFLLHGEDPDRTCSSEPKAADWVITEVRLSETGDPATEKGTFDGGVSDRVVESFPAVDRDSGVVYSASVPDGSASPAASVLNRNISEQDVYYTVTAAPCRGGQSLSVDPMVQNRGK